MNQSSPAQSGKVIPSGSRLECFCPHCASSLVEGEHLRLEMLNGRGERGTLLLSPFLNVFDSSSTLQEGKGEEAQDLFCPHCRASLKDMARRCEACGSAAARFHAESFSKTYPYSRSRLHYNVFARITDGAPYILNIISFS